MQSQALLESWLQKAQAFDSSQALLWELCSHIGVGLNLEDCVVYLVNSDRKTLSQKAVFGKKRKDAHTIVRPIEIPMGVGIVGRVAKSKVSEVIGNTSHDPDYVIDDSIRLSEMTIPIIADNQLIGVFDSEHSESDFYSHDHLAATELIIQAAAYQLLYLIQKEELEFMSAFTEQIPFAMLRIDSNQKVLRHNRNALPLIKLWGHKAGHLSNPNLNFKQQDSGLSNNWIEFTGDKYYRVEIVPEKKANAANVFAFDITAHHANSKGNYDLKNLIPGLIAEHFFVLLQTQGLLLSNQLKENCEPYSTELARTIDQEILRTQNLVLDCLDATNQVDSILIRQFLNEIVDRFYDLAALFRLKMSIHIEEKAQNGLHISKSPLVMTLALILQRMVLNSNKKEILVKFETESKPFHKGRFSILCFDDLNDSGDLHSSQSYLFSESDLSFLQTLIQQFEGEIEIQSSSTKTNLVQIKWPLR